MSEFPTAKIDPRKLSKLQTRMEGGQGGIPSNFTPPRRVDVGSPYMSGDSRWNHSNLTCESQSSCKTVKCGNVVVSFCFAFLVLIVALCIWLLTACIGGFRGRAWPEWTWIYLESQTFNEFSIFCHDYCDVAFHDAFYLVLCYPSIWPTKLIFVLSLPWYMYTKSCPPKQEENDDNKDSTKMTTVSCTTIDWNTHLLIWFPIINLTWLTVKGKGQKEEYAQQTSRIGN